MSARDKIDEAFQDEGEAAVAALLTPFGFKVINTGGGCEAWQLFIRGTELLVTEEGNPSLPRDLACPVTLTIYWCENPEDRMAGEGDRVESMDFANVPELMEYLHNDLEGDLSRV